MDKLHFSFLVATTIVLLFFLLFVFGAIAVLFGAGIANFLISLGININISSGIGFLVGILLFIFLTAFLLIYANG